MANVMNVGQREDDEQFIPTDNGADDSSSAFPLDSVGKGDALIPHDSAPAPEKATPEASPKMQLAPQAAATPQDPNAPLIPEDKTAATAAEPQPDHAQSDGKAAFHEANRGFDTAMAANRGQMMSLNPADPKYMDKLAALQTQEGLIRTEKATYAEMHPFGSPESAHPGFFGKVLHGLGNVAQVATDIVAPNVDQHIPGTHAYMNAQIRGGQEEIAGGEEANEKASRADAAKAAQTELTGDVFNDGKGGFYKTNKQGQPVPTDQTGAILQTARATAGGTPQLIPTNAPDAQAPLVQQAGPQTTQQQGGGPAPLNVNVAPAQEAPAATAKQFPVAGTKVGAKPEILTTAQKISQRQEQIPQSQWATDPTIKALHDEEASEEAAKETGKNSANPDKQAPAPDEVATFVNSTLPSYAGNPKNPVLTPQQVSSLAQEAQSARTKGDLDKVQNKALTLYSTMHKDQTDKQVAATNAAAAKEQSRTNALATKGTEDITKQWTDPQHGFGQTLAQANVAKGSIKAGADGSGLQTSLVPTMEVLGVNSFAGTHRISPAEATAAGAPGGWSEQFNAWAAKAFTGKLTPQLAEEGNRLMDQLVSAKHQQTLQASRVIAANAHLDPSSVTITDTHGEPDTLAHQVFVHTPPQGAKGKAPGPDGKLYWTDGHKVLGPAE